MGCIPYPPGGIYGTGESENFTNGVPIPWNFNGQAGWWSVPTNWFSQCVDGVIYVSPNADFSNPKYACKINLDGNLVFQSMALNLATGNLNPFLPSASSGS